MRLAFFAAFVALGTITLAGSATACDPPQAIIVQQVQTYAVQPVVVQQFRVQRVVQQQVVQRQIVQQRVVQQQVIQQRPQRVFQRSLTIIR